MDSTALTKREVAKRVGVSENTLQRWKNKESYPELPNIEKLATILEVSPLEFYKVREGSVAIQEPVSIFAKKLLSIPDKVYELAQKVGPDDPNWETVLTVLELAIEQKEIAKGAKQA